MKKEPNQNPAITPSAFSFLRSLKKNNNRDWFNAHKHIYLEERERIEKFAGALLAAMNTHDQLETLTGKESLHRIYRDTRFSNNKIPYKTYWSARFRRATKYRRGSYYLQLEPGNSYMAGGFWAPEPADLKRIRDEISFDALPFRKIINSKNFKLTFGALHGELVKTTPKGYTADDEAIDLLRFKQFLLVRHFTDKEVFDKNFVNELNHRRNKSYHFCQSYGL